MAALEEKSRYCEIAINSIGSHECFISLHPIVVEMLLSGPKCAIQSDAIIAWLKP